MVDNPADLVVIDAVTPEQAIAEIRQPLAAFKLGTADGRPARPGTRSAKLSKKKLFVLTVCTLVAAGTPSLAADQGFTKCIVGQPVMDREGKTGIVVSTDNHLCQVKYPDGQVYGWIYWNLRPANTPAHALQSTPGRPAWSGCPIADHPQGRTCSAHPRLSY